MAALASAILAPAREPTPRTEANVESSPPVDPLVSDLAAAHHYATRAARLPEALGHTWEDVAPVLRAGWSSHHAEVCTDLHDWRLAAGALAHGWREAGGAVYSSAARG